ncbi:MAG: hypothetical protein KDD73_09215 [Anaerolineales bacterium]|nr:hypothetical protein [Anaerolineales bacterium]
MLLIALVPQPRDLAWIRQTHRYRVPLDHAPTTLATAKRLAFYQPSSFGDERWQVAWWAETRGLEVLTRHELLPDAPTHRRADALYAVVSLGPLQRVEPPKRAEKGRRILFVPTSWAAFEAAHCLDDLFDHAPRPIADAPLYQILQAQIEGHDTISGPTERQQLRLLESFPDSDALDW